MLSKRLSHVQPSLTLAISAKAKELKAQGVDVVSFGAGEPDFDTPAEVVNAAKAALDQGETKYTPASGTPELKKAIAAWYEKTFDVSAKSSEVIVSVGGKQVLYNACMALLDNGDKVLIPAPYWLSYPAMAHLAGAVPVFVDTKEEDDFLLTPQILRNALETHKPKLLILNSPSNPTGTAYDVHALKELAKVLEDYPEVYIIWDNIYAHLVYDGFVHKELANVAPALKERIIVAGGLSKCYAMTGWRIGFGIAPEPIIKAMTNIQSHSTSNPTTFAQSGALAALTLDYDFPKIMRESFAHRRSIILELINNAEGLTCAAPHGAFYVLVNVKAFVGKAYKGQAPLTDDLAIANYLIEEASVATVPGSAFGAPGYLRLSFAVSEAHIIKGVNRIIEALHALQ